MKDCLINEYRYGVLIENIPNCISRKRLLEIAQDAIRDCANKPFYIMGNVNYTPNPCIMPDSFYFDDYECRKDPKCFPESEVDFKVDYQEYINNFTGLYIRELEFLEDITVSNFVPVAV